MKYGLRSGKRGSQNLRLEPWTCRCPDKKQPDRCLVNYLYVRSCPSRFNVFDANEGHVAKSIFNTDCIVSWIRGIWFPRNRRRSGHDGTMIPLSTSTKRDPADGSKCCHSKGVRCYGFRAIHVLPNFQFAGPQTRSGDCGVCARRGRRQRKGKGGGGAWYKPVTRRTQSRTLEGLHSCAE